MITAEDDSVGGAARVETVRMDAASAQRRIERLGRGARGPDLRLARLAGLASRAGDLAQARAYGRDAGSLREPLSLLRAVPGLLGSLLYDDPTDDDAPEVFDREVALRIGRPLAQGVHVALHRAWRDGQRGDGTSRPRAAVARMVMVAERTYRRQLLSSRSACRARRPERLQSLLTEVVDGAFERLVPLTRDVARLPPQERDAGALGIRIARLGRRAALLASAIVVLRARFTSRRTIRTTAEIAGSRTLLSRNDSRLRATGRTLGNASEGARVGLRGRTRDIAWVARPNTPYTRVRLHGTETALCIHHKNAARLGLQADMAIWAAGKVEDVAGARALVVEFEGPGQHAGRCWEDWLASELRPAYDLYPQVLRMDWEYPPAAGTRISADLRARLGRRQPKEV